MTWWRWTCLAIGVIGLAVVVLLHPGGKRNGLRALLDSLLMYAPAYGVAGVASAIGGIAAWSIAISLYAAAVWFGRTPLGLLNFLVLQWFGVRLGRALPGNLIPGPYRIVDVDSMDAAAAHGFATGDVVHIRSTGRWSLLRWVYPLTGWWSRYRYIHRSPP